MQSRIEKWRIRLEEASVKGVAEFIGRVKHNAKVPENVESFLCEARAALMFRENGFSVMMRDHPDLELGYGGVLFYAEVKQFRLKKQDVIDETSLIDAGRQALKDNLSVLVRYGDTQETKEKPPWQQLVDVAQSKTNQYHEGSPNILVIFSSSPHCVEDADFYTAAYEIDDDIAAGKTPGLEKLSGLLFVTKAWTKVTGRRRVFFAPLHHSAIPLPQEIREALGAVRCCRWNPW
jgi:hypothetical protein